MSSLILHPLRTHRDPFFLILDLMFSRIDLTWFHPCTPVPEASGVWQTEMVCVVPFLAIALFRKLSWWC